MTLSKQTSFLEQDLPSTEPLGPGAVILRQFATPVDAALLANIQEVAAQAAFGIWLLQADSGCRLR